MQHWWNDINMGKSKQLEKNLSPFPTVCHKSYTDWSGIEPGSLQCSW